MTQPTTKDQLLNALEKYYGAGASGHLLDEVIDLAKAIGITTVTIVHQDRLSEGAQPTGTLWVHVKNGEMIDFTVV